MSIFFKVIIKSYNNYFYSITTFFSENMSPTYTKRCCVNNCSSNDSMDDMKFYMFPKDPNQREVWKNVQNLFKGICAKDYAKFLRKSCAIGFLLFKGFQRAVKSQNPMTGSRCKYRFSLVKVK